MLFTGRVGGHDRSTNSALLQGSTRGIHAKASWFLAQQHDVGLVGRRREQHFTSGNCYVSFGERIHVVSVAFFNAGNFGIGFLALLPLYPTHVFVVDGAVQQSAVANVVIGSHVRFLRLRSEEWLRQHGVRFALDSSS